MHSIDTKTPLNNYFQIAHCHGLSICVFNQCLYLTAKLMHIAYHIVNESLLTKVLHFLSILTFF